MVRAPCCDKIGMKKGPWTPEEDEILTSYIQKHGHANWRALPKQAGLLRCGKSCRLRWINYLRPDIKRGNFTNEEEDIIIKMHELLGNRWSAIAAKLPGRTDNEIKNVWHTHLKKKTNNQQTNSNGKRVSKSKIKRSDSNSSTVTTTSSTSTFSSDFSSPEGKTIDNNIIMKSEEEPSESLVTMPEIDESFWSEAANDDACSNMASINDSWTVSNELPNHQYSSSDSVESIQHQESFDYSFDDGMDFWYDLFLRSGESIEFPEF